MGASKLVGAPLGAVLPASDIKRASAFYADVLGLDVEDVPAAVGFYVHAGKGTNAIVYETAASHGDATAAAFLVEDLALVMDDLRSRGVVFEEYDMPGVKTIDGIVDMGPMGKAAWFKDSEGNTINVAQM